MAITNLICPRCSVPLGNLELKNNKAHWTVFCSCNMGLIIRYDKVTDGPALTQQMMIRHPSLVDGDTPQDRLIHLRIIMKRVERQATKYAGLAHDFRDEIARILPEVQEEFQVSQDVDRALNNADGKVIKDLMEKHFSAEKIAQAMADLLNK